MFSAPFSGSHIENWHSILRNGLVNASYTKLQVRVCPFPAHLVSGKATLKYSASLASMSSSLAHVGGVPREEVETEYRMGVAVMFDLRLHLCLILGMGVYSWQEHEIANCSCFELTC